MSWTTVDGVFAIAGLGEELLPEDLEALRLPPSQVVREPGETTILAREAIVLEIAARHPGTRVEHDLAWIRFELPMAWDVVGFLACVSAALAAAGIPIGAVCGFSRDHVFVPRARLPQALAALARLRPDRSSEASPVVSRDVPRG